MKTIRYAYHPDNYVVSQCGNELAWPILDYEAIGKDGNYKKPLEYNLEKMSVHAVGKEWGMLVWTRFLPICDKNVHREFWGLKSLPVEELPQTVEDLCREHRVTRYYLLLQPGKTSWHKPARNRRVVAIFHGVYGGSGGLYHVFQKTSKGYQLQFITDERPEDTLKRRVASAAACAG